MHNVRIESEIPEIEKGNILAATIDFDNLQSKDLSIKTYYDENKKVLITEIKCKNLRTLQNTIYDLLKNYELVEKILSI